MRTLLFGCLGLISISSLAGCSLFGSSHDDCAACKNRPVARMVTRNGVVVAEAPTGTTGIVTISESAQPGEQIVVLDSRQLAEPDRLPPIPQLPLASSKELGEPAPFQIATMAQSEPARGRVLPRDAVEIIVEPPMSPRCENAANDPRAKEKTIALKSVHIQYGHSEGFKTVTGQVQMWRGTVRLRYAPIDQEDQYGGFVVLEGGAELTRMRDGQHIRIRGVLIAPEDRNSAAHYRVQAIEALD